MQKEVGGSEGGESNAAEPSVKLLEKEVVVGRGEALGRWGRKGRRRRVREAGWAGLRQEVSTPVD